MSGYDPKSCSGLSKPYYTPIEAAIRWCGLIAHEPEILGKAGDAGIPAVSDFPAWPCLKANAERIMDALNTGEMPRSREGIPVGPKESVARHRLTVRHSDLKSWMLAQYPGQKPSFLFDETEQAAHSAINADSFRALQADRDAARAELEKAKAWAADAIREMDAMRSERDSLRAMVDKASPPGGRSERTYLSSPV